MDAQRLRELVHYDPDTGIFTQAITYQGRGSRWKPGRVVGSLCKQSGYLTIRLDGTLYQAHLGMFATAQEAHEAFARAKGVPLFAR